jgi:hypothetical protein
VETQHQKYIVFVPILTNMADEKVYQPEIIQENPFPGEVAQSVLSENQGDTKENLTPTTDKEKTFPIKKIAIELLSTALNTRSRKILKEFDLQQSGGFQIGNFQEGLSGDLRLTPNGMTARNIAGITTFAIDGDTGDAIFAGQVRAGSTIVADTIVTEQSSNGNGRTVYYNNGIPAIVIGDVS